MKKHITLSALLVTGSALANAATDLTYIGNVNYDLLAYSEWGYFFNLEDTKVDGTWGTRPGDPEIGTTALAFAGVPRDSSTNPNSEGSVYKALTTIGNTDYNLIFKNTGSVTINHDVYFNQVSTSGSLASYTLNFGTTGSITTGDKLDFGASASSIAISVDIDTNALVSGENYERTLLTGKSNWGIWNYSDRNPSLTNIESLEALGYDNIGVVTDKSTIGTGEYGLFYSNTNNTDTVSLIVGVIPEPSAFGLLAGLGALALVGARRRRR